ncbi:hypothetical protein IAU60_000617 [Kwoniella sp. DSM 27419]
MSAPGAAAEAGPSRLKSGVVSASQQASRAAQADPVLGEEGEQDDPRAVVGGPARGGPAQGSASAGGQGQGDEGDEEGDDERMDIKLIQSFADKIQHLPSTGDIDGATGRVQITIPKRGEKDFEPLEETVNLQDMMLQRSREALFNALVGVRGGHSKSISHAFMTPANPYPRLLIVHGHLLDSIGITVRSPPSPADPKGKGKTSLQLLPEEALYLLERGSLQIWIGNEPTPEQAAEGHGEWCEEEFGVKGAVEMSVMEGFGAFIGREGLTWERYQAYAYLKRLGYTVHRARQFIPSHFLAEASPSPTARLLDEQDLRFPRFRTWWLNIPGWIAGLFRALYQGVGRVVNGIASVGLGLQYSLTGRGRPFRGTLLDGWMGKTNSSIFSHLRVIPAGHSQPLPRRAPPPPPSTHATIYDPLRHNPYLPFFHIWKPATPWNKRTWDKGSEEGIKAMKPDYYAGVVESRNTPLPTINQLAEIFDKLPDEPKGPIKKVGPQYVRPPRPARPSPQQGKAAAPPTLAQRAFEVMGLGWLLQPVKKEMTPFINLPELRNGDRAFIVAVNDSGNTGWIRFGRAGFADTLVI